MDVIGLNTLPYAEGASWNLSRVCLDSTSGNSWNWINSTGAGEAAEIMRLKVLERAPLPTLLQSVVTRRTCFFFDREIAGRNGPQKLFSTIARDLAILDVNLAKQIGPAIQHDESLATASTIRQ